MWQKAATKSTGAEAAGAEAWEKREKERMERTLFALTALFLGAFSMEVYETFCHGEECPPYKLCYKTSKFEKRCYPSVTWIDTFIESKLTVNAAYDRLKSYCDNSGDAGKRISKTWPGLIRKVGNDYHMQWFVPFGVSLDDYPSQSVTVKTETNATFYVREFDGIPSLTNGEDNANSLRADLDAEGKCYSNSEYIGAGYESYFEMIHHNEIWIYVTPNCVHPEEDCC